MNSFKAGSEFRVDTAVHGSSTCPVTVALASGGFVVSWTENIHMTSHTGGPDIKARLYTSSGEPVGREFFVNRETHDYQQDPKIAALPDGGFVAIWQDFSGRGGDDSGSGIKARIFSRRGEAVGSEFLVNKEIKNNQTNPAVSALSKGGFVAAWQDFSGTLGDDSCASIKARIFGSDGAPRLDDFLVNTNVHDNQVGPSVTSLSTGGFVVVWNDFSGTLGDVFAGSIKAKVFGPVGDVVREEFLVNSRKWNNQNRPVVSGLEDGFVVAWTDASGSLGDNSSSSIKARLFDELGMPVTDDFLVNSETFNTQIHPSIAALTDGTFLIAWSDYSRQGGDESSSGIKAKLFSVKGTALQEEFLVNTETRGEQNAPTATGLLNGGFVVCWQDHGNANNEGKLNAIKGKMFRRTETQQSLTQNEYFSARSAQ